ncbi:hypothetical protein RND81_01G055100 [Saponaria officinalis]|uniref:Uncharacterized protein n=1 Tax=Saponaria officinalis TaxID=3572 RepID=A0AAW1NGM0_SAPOF
MFSPFMVFFCFRCLVSRSERSVPVYRWCPSPSLGAFVFVFVFVFVFLFAFSSLMSQKMRKIGIVINRYMVLHILSDSWLQSITSEEIDTRQGRFGDPLMDESLLRPTDDGDSVEVDQSLNKNLFPMVVIVLYPFEFGICYRCRMTFY